MSFSYCDWPLVHFYRPRRYIYLCVDHTTEQVDIKVEPLAFFHFSRSSLQFMIDPCTPLLQEKDMQRSWKLTVIERPSGMRTKWFSCGLVTDWKSSVAPFVFVAAWLFFWLEMMCLHFATVTVLLNWQLRLLTGHRGLNKAVKMKAAFKHVWDVNREAQETQSDVRGG